LVAYHSNGSTLTGIVWSGKVLADLSSTSDPGVGGDAWEELLRVHRSYLGPVDAIRRVTCVKGLAHLTGGAFVDNIPRILPDGVGVEI